MNRRQFLIMTAGAVSIWPLSGAAGVVRGDLPNPPASPSPTSKPIGVPLKALSTNPHYFTDGSGKAIYLTGSHTWNTFQDWGTNDSIQPLDFSVFVKMLTAHQHNFTLLWTVELPKFHGMATTADSPPDFSVTPQPWQRTGPGNASDGKLKFDLTKFNQAYFDRLRDRVRQLNAAGIYAGVYFFTGEFVNVYRSPSDGYPFTGSNNVNGIDDGGGIASVTMTAPSAITALQDAYVKKMIDTLNDLPNVLWIVSRKKLLETQHGGIVISLLSPAPMRPESRFNIPSAMQSGRTRMMRVL